jgi:hypothetical protein
MFGITVKVIGGEIFRKNADPKGVISAASSAFMRAQGAVYLSYAIQEAPVGRTGLLKASHVLRVINPFRAEVVNTATRDGFPYPIAVQEGTRPHFPPESSGLPYPVRRSIGLHGTKPNPWMSRAYDRGQADIATNLEKMAADIAKEIV